MNILLQKCRILLYQYFTSSIFWNPNVSPSYQDYFETEYLHPSASRLTCLHQPHNTYVKSPLLRNWVVPFPSAVSSVVVQNDSWACSDFWIKQLCYCKSPSLISSVVLYCYFDFHMCETACLHIMFLKFYDNVWGTSRFIALEEKYRS